MYFWRIIRLKQQLAKEPLSAQSAFAYLCGFILVNTLLFALAIFTPVPPSYTDSLLFFLVTLIIELAFIYLAYSANGGKAGKDFLGRFVALFWVIFCRFAVFGLILYIAGMFVIELFTGHRDFFTPHMIWSQLFFLVWVFALFSRLYQCFKQVSVLASH